MEQGAFQLGEIDSGGDHGQTLTVTQLGELISGSLRRSFGDGVWVRGEIKGWNKSSAGHIYFDLVEADARSKAVVSVVFFAGSQHGPRERFRRAGLKLGEGLQVRVFGSVDFHVPTGRLSLRITDIDPRYTLGDLAARRHQLVQSLVARGLYDANRAHSMPLVPLRVGVVTSVGSAAWHDFRDELHRSGLGFRLTVVDVRVQGDGAPREVAAAVTALGRFDRLDVVVVIRGGGARNELATFDDPLVAEAIATCGRPVVTGIGHETDRSVADEVAHTSLKTPTACAGALVTSVTGFSDRTQRQWEAIRRAASDAIDTRSRELGGIAAGIRLYTTTSVDRSEERLRQRRSRLVVAATSAITTADRALGDAVDAIGRVPTRLDPEVRHLDALAERVRLLDPVTTLRRGWSITRTADGRTVRDPSHLAPGDRIVTTVLGGTVDSTVLAATATATTNDRIVTDGEESSA